MLNVKEAHKKLLEKYTKSKAVKCFEYDSVFVFLIVPKDFDESKGYDDLLDTAASVDKKTGLVRNFDPMEMSLEEYNCGREVKNFK